VPLAELRQAAMDTFERLDVEADHGTNTDTDNTVIGHAGRRTVRVGFEPVTGVLTRVRVTVYQSRLRRDVATANEILTQLETTTTRSPAASSFHAHNIPDEYRDSATAP